MPFLNWSIIASVLLIFPFKNVFSSTSNLNYFSATYNFSLASAFFFSHIFFSHKTHSCKPLNFMLKFFSKMVSILGDIRIEHCLTLITDTAV